MKQYFKMKHGRQGVKVMTLMFRMKHKRVISFLIHSNPQRQDPIDFENYMLEDMYVMKADVSDAVPVSDLSATTVICQCYRT